MNTLPRPVYELGKSRGTSLATGYYRNPYGGRWFVQNPNSTGGIVVDSQGTLHSFWADVPRGYVHQEQLPTINGD